MLFHNNNPSSPFLCFNNKANDTIALALQAANTDAVKKTNVLAVVCRDLGGADRSHEAVSARVWYATSCPLLVGRE